MHPADHAAASRGRQCLLLLLPALVMIGTAGGCAGMFFWPDRAVHAWQHPNGRWEDAWFRSADGTKLHGWFVPAIGRAKGTVVHFHGNSDNITSHFGFVYWLPAHGYNVLAFDYRGFGRSEGSPTIAGCVADGLAAIEYVRGRPDVDGGRILVFGQSLGASVAATTVGRHEPKGVRGVFLDSPFSSYPWMVADRLKLTIVGIPLMPLSPLLISDEYSPDRFAHRLAAPNRRVLFLHGTHDIAVEHWHSRKLHELAGEPKELHLVEGAGHLEALDKRRDVWRPLVLRFFADSLGKAADP